MVKKASMKKVMIQLILVLMLSQREVLADIMEEFALDEITSKPLGFDIAVSQSDNDGKEICAMEGQE